MLSSKIIAIGLAVLGLGGFGVVAAAGSVANTVNDSQAQGIQSTTIRDQDRAPLHAVEPLTWTHEIEKGETHGHEISSTHEMSETHGHEISSTHELSETMGRHKDDGKWDIDDHHGFSDTITSTHHMTMPNKPAIEIALKFGLNVTDVVQLHNSGWGFGEIARLYELVKLTGKTAADIQAMRASGMGWGEIEKSLGVKPGKGDDKLGSIMSGHGVTNALSLNMKDRTNGPQVLKVQRDHPGNNSSNNTDPGKTSHNTSNPPAQNQNNSGNNGSSQNNSNHGKNRKP